MSRAIATSSSSGTTLPRRGYFLGVHPPQYQAIIVASELASTQPEAKTWSAVTASNDEAEQTAPLPLPRFGLLLEALTQTGHLPFRTDNFAHAVVPHWDSTDSTWQIYRRAVMPLRSTSDALDEDIRDTLECERLPDVRAEHAGLAAVSRLVDILGLSRPTILRMGGVPQSTFYAWQSNPYAAIRTPTISRLLRLQAQIAILDEALGRERTRSWALSAAHFAQLQGSEAAFTQALAEAAETLAVATRIRPRPRPRKAQYTATLEEEDSLTQ